MTALKPDELRLEQRRIRRNSLLACGVVAAVMSIAYFFAGPRLTWPSDLAGRFALAVQSSLPLALTLIVAVQRVSSGRYRSGADNRGAGFGQPSQRIAIDVAFLQNTLEQVVIAVIGYVGWALLATGEALVLVPTAAVLFVVGRLAFRIGYPRGAGARAFGMALTAIPSVLACLGALWLSIAGIFM